MDICPPLFTAALLTIVMRWKQARGHQRPGGPPQRGPSLGLEQQRDRNIAPTRSSLEVSAPREVR